VTGRKTLKRKRPKHQEPSPPLLRKGEDEVLEEGVGLPPLRSASLTLAEERDPSLRTACAHGVGRKEERRPLWAWERSLC